MNSGFKFPVIALVILTGSLASARAQEVSIPDPGLDAAIRDVLQRPTGLLTEQDLLSLTNLNAARRSVRSIAGLEAARNLSSLQLQENLLTNVSIPGSLTKLTLLDLSANALTNCVIPGGLTNLGTLTMEGNPLGDLELPPDLTALKSLDLENNLLTTFTLPPGLAGLVALDLGFNRFTNFSLPGGLTNLSTFYFAGNPLTSVTLPPDLAGMTELNLSQNLLTSFSLPEGMTNLVELVLSFNQLTNLDLPADLKNLTELDLDFNRFTRLNLPTNLSHLGLLHLRANGFTSIELPAGMTGLTYLDLRENQLADLELPADLDHLTSLGLSRNRFTTLVLPPGLSNLVTLNLSLNSLTNLVLPPDLSSLESLNLGGNQLASITLPAGLSHLTGLYLTGNQLTNITVPPDMARLSALGFLGNPLTSVVLPEPLADTSLADSVASLEAQGIPVLTYPLTVQLARPRPLVGAFQFGILGPPGVYTVLQSTDLAIWSPLGVTTNRLGAITFTDVSADSLPRKFYRAMPQAPPTNMILIAPNTFTMGSPTNDPDRAIEEVPQTAVTLTQGFWIGKFEVTQGEYLSVMNTNPSVFPGDLTRPVSSVTWSDATNYCWNLTRREHALGRIPPGSQYRLPTEAEWECAARAGTTTRFSYGDDPGYAGATNHMWELFSAGLTVHPVGQKLPNPWGLYDVHGNVWEWCQDWYGTLPGGEVTDPAGPPSNPDGLKVMRGGAYDYPNSSCRSASRLFRFFGMPDSDVGFRVVLAFP